MKINLSIKLLLLLCISMVSVAFIPREQTKGDLHVIAHALKNDKGQIEFALFHTAKGFPNETENAFKVIRGKIVNGTSVVIFKDIPFGNYALGLYHDENNNQKLDETWYGMPQEGIAVSNNPALGLLHPPRFEVAKFVFNTDQQVVSIKIKYL